ncbi:hypothetical protein C0J52_22946, partial [Blattella germanica]
ESFFVLKFESCKSVITVLRAFRRQFNCDPSNANIIRQWHNKLATTGCLCKGKSVGRHRVSEENVRDAFVRSPKESIRKDNRELAMPVMTVWKVLRKRLHMRHYRLQLLQTLKPTDYAVRSNFAHEMLHQENDFLDSLK